MRNNEGVASEGVRNEREKVTSMKTESNKKKMSHL